MSYVSVICNFKATIVINFIRIGSGVFEIYCETKGGVYFLNTVYSHPCGQTKPPKNRDFDYILKFGASYTHLLFAGRGQI